MKKVLFPGVLFFLATSISLSAGARPAGAQGPAGAGAAAASQDTTSHLNPMNWVRKDSKSSSDAAANRPDQEKKLTTNLQNQGVLAANANATDACAPFKELDSCLAALHVSHNLGLDFNCVRAGVTGVHTNADLSGCKIVDSEKAQGLHKTIHELKPDANAKQASKDAEQQAKDDLKAIAG